MKQRTHQSLERTPAPLRARRRSRGAVRLAGTSLSGPAAAPVCSGSAPSAHHLRRETRVLAGSSSADPGQRRRKRATKFAPKPFRITSGAPRRGARGITRFASCGFTRAAARARASPFPRRSIRPRGGEARARRTGATSVPWRAAARHSRGRRRPLPGRVAHRPPGVSRVSQCGASAEEVAALRRTPSCAVPSAGFEDARMAGKDRDAMLKVFGPPGRMTGPRCCSARALRRRPLRPGRSAKRNQRATAARQKRFMLSAHARHRRPALRYRHAPVRRACASAMMRGRARRRRVRRRPDGQPPAGARGGDLRLRGGAASFRPARSPTSPR